MRTTARMTLTALLLATLACDNDDDAGDEQPGSRRRGSTRERNPVYPEAQAVDILLAINDAEVITAQAAQDRSQNDDVLRFASVMIADHRAISRYADSLLNQINVTAQSNVVSQQIRTGAEAFSQHLLALDSGFNNNYMAGQIREHERALQLLDTALIPSARNQQIRAMLQQLRPTVAAHLQRARQILAARQAMAARRATGATTLTPPRPRPPERQVEAPQPEPPPLPPPDTLIPPPTTTEM